MRGKISCLKDNYGFIKIHQQKEGYLFTKESLIGLSFDELKLANCVDFTETTYKGKKRASHVRKTPLEWVEGRIVRQSIAPWGDVLWSIEALKGREFWFVENNISLGEKKEDFNIGDSVRFQCGGYYANISNQAYMITKKHIGYITYYNSEKKTGVIDFRYKFSLMNLNNATEYYLDTKRYFYLVSYDIEESRGEFASNIYVMNETVEILFDQCEKWIDGHVERKGISKDLEDYFIIAPRDNPSCTFKGNETNMKRYCNADMLKEKQQVSFCIDDDGSIYDVAWLGYITRFPTNPVVVDMSARINTKIYQNESEELEPELLYFRKYKIHNFRENEECTRFWLEDILLGGENKIIPIKTENTNLRYKVIFGKDEDSVYGEKAISIKIIGIAKAPFDERKVNKIEPENDELIPAQVIINNYYAPVYNQTNILQVNNADDFFELLRQRRLSIYVNDISNKLEVSSTDCSDDYYASEFANKIFPNDFKELTDENVNTLEYEFEKARIIHPEITDVKLKNMSEDCSLYVKVAVIVEFALSHLQEISLGDFSAQMVMYGKALEQALRDYLYEFITSDEELCNYVDFKGNSFANLEKQSSMIGNYTTLLKRKNERLAQLCERRQNKYCKIYKVLHEWKQWWAKLQMDVDNAREIRNNSDHAGSTVQLNSLSEMCTLLFADEGIFDSLQLVSVMNVNESVLEENAVGQNAVVDFWGDYMSGTSLIVGKLATGERAALHIKQVKKGFTSPDEFKELFEKSKEKSLKVKMVEKTSKGISLSMII